MKGNIDPRIAYLDTHSPAFFVAVAGFILLVVGFTLFPPACLAGAIALVIGLAYYYSERPKRHSPGEIWLSSPGAWCTKCGGPALWMPKVGRWYCNSCSTWLAADLPPPAFRPPG